MTYYATLTTMGVDLFPVAKAEILISTLLNLVGILSYSVIVGNFADVLERMT